MAGETSGHPKIYPMKLWATNNVRASLEKLKRRLEALNPSRSSTHVTSCDVLSWAYILAIWKFMKKKLISASINQGYDLTETCAGGTFSEYDDTSVSRVHPLLPFSFIKLVDWPKGGYLISDSPVPHGGIVISGSNVILGYFKNDEKSKEVYKVDDKGMRWFHTGGDVGRFHADGCLEVLIVKRILSNYSMENMLL